MINDTPQSLVGKRNHWLKSFNTRFVIDGKNSSRKSIRAKIFYAVLQIIIANKRASTMFKWGVFARRAIQLFFLKKSSVIFDACARVFWKFFLQVNRSIRRAHLDKRPGTLRSQFWSVNFTFRVAWLASSLFQIGHDWSMNRFDKEFVLSVRRAAGLVRTIRILTTRNFTVDTCEYHRVELHVSSHEEKELFCCDKKLFDEGQIMKKKMRAKTTKDLQ